MNIARIFVFAISFTLLGGCAAEVQSESRWVLLSAPKLLPSAECEIKEPCTGYPYVRAPLSDWERLGEFDNFQKCGAGIQAPKSDSNESIHKQGKLSDAEKMVGVRCVQLDDKRLLSPPPYVWNSESLIE
jgi:hypothetical protein